MRARADGVAPLAARAALLVALVAVLAGIWVLTGQQSEDTMELSERVVCVAQEALGLIGHEGSAADDAAAGEGDGSGGDSGDADAGADTAAAEAVDDAQAIHYTRFAAHVAEYALLAAVAALCALAWAGRRVRPLPLLAGTVLFCAACSFADEAHRWFVPERDIDLLDFGLDAIGYVLGASLVFLVVCWLRRHRSARRPQEALG